MRACPGGSGTALGGKGFPLRQGLAPELLGFSNSASIWAVPFPFNLGIHGAFHEFPLPDRRLHEVQPFGGSQPGVGSGRHDFLRVRRHNRRNGGVRQAQGCPGPGPGGLRRGQLLHGHHQHVPAAADLQAGHQSSSSPAWPRNCPSSPRTTRRSPSRSARASSSTTAPPWTPTRWSSRSSGSTTRSNPFNKFGPWNYWSGKGWSDTDKKQGIVKDIVKVDDSTVKVILNAARPVDHVQLRPLLHRHRLPHRRPEVGRRLQEPPGGDRPLPVRGVGQGRPHRPQAVRRLLGREGQAGRGHLQGVPG